MEPFDGDVLGRGKRSIALDLKQPEGRDVARRLAADADVVLEGFRPGVMERFGLAPGPDVGRLVELAREAHAAGEVTTKEEALALVAHHIGQPDAGGYEGNGEARLRE